MMQNKFKQSVGNLFGNLVSFGVKKKNELKLFNLILNNRSLSTLPILKEEIKEKLNLKLENVNLTHESLDGKIKYKFEGYSYYPSLSVDDLESIRNNNYINNNNMNWRSDLKMLIDYEFEEESIYSLGVVGISSGDNNGKIKFVTFGPHVLVTNEIDIEELITYIEGKIDSLVLNIESGKIIYNDNIEEETVIQFKYRKVLISKEIHKTISKIKYTDKLKTEKIDFKKSEELIKINNNKNIIKYLNVIPLNCDLEKFGEIINENYKSKDGKEGVFYKYNENINILIYAQINNTHSGIIYKNGFEYLRFKDIKSHINNDEYDFIREIGNNRIYLKDNKIKFMETLINSRLIEQKKRSLINNKKFVTLDIECYLEENNNIKDKNNKKNYKFIPYFCQWYTKKENKYYEYNKFNSWDNMIEKCIEDLQFKYNNYTIYAHNLSNFDGIFLLKILYKNYKTKILFKDEKSISIEISDNKYNKNNIKGKNIINLKFKDSLLLLPLKLEKLIEDFSIESKKLLFPYKFVTKENLNYEGDIPSYNYFNKYFNLKNYNNYLKLSKNYDKDNKWNLMEESRKYILNDVKSLYEIIEIFNKEIYDLESYNITDVISISSLALNIFLTNYYDQNKTPIHIPKVAQYKEIKTGYFGGRVEIFKQYGENLYIYDVNSLYPFVMLKDMPVGKIIKSSDNNLDNYFGFCYATVNVPENINKPILSYRDELGNVYNPVGKWEGMFSSEILKYARDNQNVEITVHYGYKFEKGKDVFRKYVERYYNLKKEAKDNISKKLLYKLLLNSLYGRFGLKYINSKTKFVTSSEAIELSLKYQILENITIDEENDLELIKYTLDPSDVLKYIDQKSYIDLITNKEKINEDFINRSLPISAMVTSYASCYMQTFLNLPDNECFYSDTDSVILQKPLDPKYVGDNIGQFKFVDKIKKGYFISPKLYCLVLENGEIIIKSKGIDKREFNENDFIEMLNGLTLKKDNIYRFKRDLKNLTINYDESNFIITPQNLKRESIYENNFIIDTKPLQVKDGNLIQIASIKLIFNLVLYNPNKYSIILYNSNKQFILLNNSNQYSIELYNSNKYALIIINNK